MNIFSIFSLSATKETSFFEDIINYFNDAVQFENMSGTGSLVSLPLLVIGLFIGAAIAVIASVYNRKVLGDFVRTLIREGCTSPETARDLDYLNYIYKDSIRMAVKRGTNLRRVVKCREEEEHNAKMAALQAEYEAKKAAGEKVEKFTPTEYVPNPYLDHFYIPEELRYTAEIKFDKKGSSWLGAIIGILALLVLMIAVLLVLPQILKFVDNFIGVIKG